MKQLTSLKDSTSVVPLYHGDEDEANLGRLFWLADVVDAPYKHAKKMLLRAYVYDEKVVVLGAVTRVQVRQAGGQVQETRLPEVALAAHGCR